MFGHALKLKSKLYQQETPVEKVSNPPDITTAVGFLYNGAYYPTEAEAQQARIAHKVRELIVSPVQAYTAYPCDYEYRKGFEAAVGQIIKKLPELNRIINL